CVESRAIDDQLRLRPSYRRHDCVGVRNIQGGVVERDEVVTRRDVLGDNGGAQLTTSTCDSDAHQAAFSGLAAANAHIRESSNTPSQRATTTVAMQLPMTFTAVRPISIT